MIVYHGSSFCVVHPSIDHSRNSTDFSKGFYLTKIKEQAILWATKKKYVYNEGLINTYELNEKKLKNFNVLEFESYTIEWLNFVCNCRNKKDETKYDVVIGPIADDKVYDTINLFLSGLCSAEVAISKLKAVKPNMQICIRSQRAIDELLTYKSTEAV